MSKLKDYSILDIEAIDDERYEKEKAPGKWVSESRVYLKSEADAELNRQKYLRCESLIKTCLTKSQTWSCRYYYAETDSRRKICFDFMIHYNKRAEVLRKLAEKFKEAK